MPPARRRKQPTTAARRLLVDLAVAFENEIWRHFAFEEKHLFGYFDESGEPEMARHLTDEHVQIRNLGVPLIAMARAPRRPDLRRRLGTNSARRRTNSSSN